METKKQNHASDAVRLPSLPGTYALLLASRVEQDLQVGSFGCMKLLPGFYVYVGSAFGPGGLNARVARHLAADKKLRWHVDYVRMVTRPAAVWYAVDPDRRECRWAEVLAAMTGVSVPMIGFGASDCACCSHLFSFRVKPSSHVFRRRVHKAVSGHAPISCITLNELGEG